MKQDEWKLARTYQRSDQTDAEFYLHATTGTIDFGRRNWVGRRLPELYYNTPT